MNPRTRRFVVGSLACLVLAVLAVTAWAYWTDGGVGTASAIGATFDAPVIAVPTVSNGTVTLAWTPSPGPGPGVVDYVVERRVVGTEAWTSACGTGAVRTTSTTCSEVPGDGTWEWHVIAHFRTWTATSDESDAVNVDDPDNGAPSGEVTAPAAGGAVRGTTSVSSDSADADSGVASVRFQRSPHGTGVWTTIGVPDTTAPYAVTWDTTTVTDGLYDLRVDLHRQRGQRPHVDNRGERAGRQHRSDRDALRSRRGPPARRAPGRRCT